MAHPESSVHLNARGQIEDFTPAQATAIARLELALTELAMNGLTLYATPEGLVVEADEAVAPWPSLVEHDNAWGGYRV